MISGGTSSEHEVSLRSGAAVAAGLRQAGHEVTEVTIRRDGQWFSGSSPVALQAGSGMLGCDVAFPILHGPGGEDGTVQGLLECLDLPYVGSDVASSAICLDKITFKRLLRSRGIAQVGFVDASDPGWRDRAAALGLPVWVKPARLGSSVGIAKVESLDDLDAAVEAARGHDPRVIIEAGAEGATEIECSLLGNEEVLASVPGEIVPRAAWYDYEAKYDEGGMELVIPARVAEDTAERVRWLAVEVFRLAGCSGLARCDFFVAGEVVLVNELNTLPGFTETSVYSKLLEASGIGYTELCDRLVDLAALRYEQLQRYKF